MKDLLYNSSTFSYLQHFTIIFFYCILKNQGNTTKAIKTTRTKVHNFDTSRDINYIFL